MQWGWAAFDDIIIAVRSDQGLDIGGVGGSDIRFSHGEGGADFSLKQGGKPLGLLLSRAEHMQDFHIAGIRGAAIENFR